MHYSSKFLSNFSLTCKKTFSPLWTVGSCLEAWTWNRWQSANEASPITPWRSELLWSAKKIHKLNENHSFLSSKELTQYSWDEQFEFIKMNRTKGRIYSRKIGGKGMSDELKSDYFDNFANLFRQEKIQGFVITDLTELFEGHQHLLYRN